jgi:hypothetical protein
MDNRFGLTGGNLFRAESPLDPFDRVPKRSNHFARHPQTIQRGELVLLHRSNDMTDAGRASKGIDQQEDKKGSGKNPEENANSFFSKEEGSHQGTGDHQRKDNTPGAIAFCSPGDDPLDVGEVEVFVVLGEPIAIHGKNMIIAQVERASGEREGDEPSSAGASARESLISGFSSAIHVVTHRRETR